MKTLPLLFCLIAARLIAQDCSFKPSPDWSSTGPQTVFVALLRYTDLNPSFTRDTAVSNVNATCAFFRDSSCGVTTLTPTITTTFLLLPHASTYYAGDKDLIALDARAAAAAAGYGNILDNYDHVVYAFPQTSGIGSSGQSGGKEIWLRNTIVSSLLSHEMGHQYNLWHAHRWLPCDLNNPVDSCGTQLEYGDCWDMMGKYARTHDFNPYEKNRMAWLDPAQIVNVTASGTYRIYRFDSPAANTFPLLAITFPQPGTTRTYWIAYRYSLTNTRLGATVMWSDGISSTLIDFHAVTTGCAGDTQLPVGATLTDQNVLITPVWLGGVGPDFWIDVRIDF
jgi:hypothetical protein